MKWKLLLIFTALAVSIAAQTESLNQKFILAQSYKNAGDYKTAQKLFEELYQNNPSDAKYISALYEIYVQTKNYAAAVNILEKRIVDNPEDISAFGMLGSVYYLMGNESKAYEVWDKPFSGGNTNPVLYRVIADYAVMHRAFDKAIELYEKGKSLSGDKVVFSYDLARLYSMTMQYKKAAEEYCFIITSDPQQFPNAEQRIFEYINKPGALDATLNVAEEKADNENINLKYLLARLYTEKKLYEKAFDVYLEIDESQKNNGKDLYKFADYLFKEGSYELASEIFEKIIGFYPQSDLIAQVKLGYARSLEADLFEKYTGTLPLWKPYFPQIKFESAETENVLIAFDEVINLYKNSPPAYEAILRKGIVEFYLLGNSKESKILFEKVINEAPLSQSAPEAYEELGNIELTDGNLKEAENYYAGMLKLKGLTTGQMNIANYNLAKIKSYQNDFEKAKSYLSDILTNLKDNSANDALEYSLILNTSMNDSSNIILFTEAEFLTDQKKFGEAAEKYKLISQNPQAFVLHSIATLRYAEMMIALNNYTEAVSVMESISADGSKDIYADKALYLLGKVYQFGLEDSLNAEKFYQQLLIKFPDSIYTDDAREQLSKFMNKTGSS